VDNWNNITNSQNRVRKKSFGGTFCFSNCHILRLDTGGLKIIAREKDTRFGWKLEDSNTLTPLAT
jgi:hypothetical protein